MTEPTDAAAKSDVMALAARIRDLEAQVIRMPIGINRLDGDTNGCTNCNTNGCTNCRGDRFVDVLLPGERAGLSGAELVTRLQTNLG